MNASNAEDPARSVAIATALSGLPPEAINPVLKNLNHPIINHGNREALGSLLDAASAIQPATPESIKLFMDSIGRLGDIPGARDAAALLHAARGCDSRRDERRIGRRECAGPCP